MRRSSGGSAARASGWRQGRRRAGWARAVQPGDDPEAARPGHLTSGALQACGNQSPDRARAEQHLRGDLIDTFVRRYHSRTSLRMAPVRSPSALSHSGLRDRERRGDRLRLNDVRMHSYLPCRHRGRYSGRQSRRTELAAQSTQPGLAICPRSRPVTIARSPRHPVDKRESEPFGHSSTVNRGSPRKCSRR